MQNPKGHMAVQFVLTSLLLLNFFAGCIQDKGFSPEYKQQWQYLPWYLKGAMEPGPHYLQGSLTFSFNTIC